MGYIGGSTIPFLASIALISFGENWGISTSLAIKISVVMAAIWWLVFTIPFLRHCKQNYGIEKPADSHIIKETFASIAATLKKIMQNKKIFYYIVAYFFYIDGVNTVINMSTAYGTTLGLSSNSMVLALLVTQIVAFPCSVWFAALAEKFGSLKMIKVAVAEYLIICILGFIMGYGLEEKLFGVNVAIIIFWTLAIMVGTVQGGIQATARSCYAQMIPPENSGEYFGFFDIFGKFAAIVGPLLYSFTKGLTGRSSYSILSIIILFALALAVLQLGKKHFVDDEKK